MVLVISFERHVLHGERGERARKAAQDHFDAACVTPEQAARAAWELEGAIEYGEDYEVTDEVTRQADAWWEAPEAVARALGLTEDGIRVELSDGQ